VQVINEVSELEKEVAAAFGVGNNILLMSSGKFEGAKFSF